MKERDREEEIGRETEGETTNIACTESCARKCDESDAVRLHNTTAQCVAVRSDGATEAEVVVALVPTAIASPTRLASQRRDIVGHTVCGVMLGPHLVATRARQ